MIDGRVTGRKQAIGVGARLVGDVKTGGGKIDGVTSLFLVFAALLFALYVFLVRQLLGVCTGDGTIDPAVTATKQKADETV